MKRTIGVDIDGVLADFDTAYIDAVVRMSGRDLFPERPFDIPTWNYPEYYGYTEAEVAAVWQWIEQDDRFWQTLPGYPDTQESADYLREEMAMGTDVYFVTSRPGATAKTQTERWLRKYQINPTVLLSSAKGLIARGLRLDIYIDDRWENALDVAQTNTRSVLMNRPWNRDYDAEGYGIRRTNTVVGFASPVAAEQPIF